jgi:hypothetical protein
MWIVLGGVLPSIPAAVDCWALRPGVTVREDSGALRKTLIVAQVTSTHAGCAYRTRAQLALGASRADAPLLDFAAQRENMPRREKGAATKCDRVSQNPAHACF